MDLRLFRNGDKPFGIHGPAQDAAHWRRTVVAEERGLALGLGSILLSSTHRHQYLVEIDVEPSSRGRGIGRALFDQLLEVRAEPYPLMARAMTSRPERLAFATALGFQILMTCPSPQVEPAAAAVRDWCDLQPYPDGIGVVPVGAVSVASLVDAWTTYYEWVHQSWAPITSREAVSASFEEQMLPTIGTTPSMVALHDQRIVALGFVSGQWDGRTFIIAETVLADEPRGDQLVAAVTAAMLRELARQDYALVEFEGHDVDPHIDIIKSIPAVRHDPLTILISPT